MVDDVRIKSVELEGDYANEAEAFAALRSKAEQDDRRAAAGLPPKKTLDEEEGDSSDASR